MTLDPQLRKLKGLSFNQLLNTLITLKKEINCRTKDFSKNFAPQSIFIIGVVILIHNSKFKTRKDNFNLQWLRSFWPEKSKTRLFQKNMTVWSKRAISIWCCNFIHQKTLKTSFWAYFPINSITKILLD